MNYLLIKTHWFMKATLRICLIVPLVILMLGFKAKNEIPPCYVAFKDATNLTAGNADRLPETAEKVRTVKTDSGEVEVTRIDGYRVLYNNDKNVAFVNLKVERSDKKHYDTDKQRLISHLTYLNAHSLEMESKELIELDYNGYKIYGLSRGKIETGSNLGTFIMFPGNDIAVYFYFNNMKPEDRNFKTLEDYKIQRNRFIEEYTWYLKTCRE